MDDIGVLLYFVTYLDWDLLAKTKKEDFDLAIIQLLFDLVARYETRYKTLPRPDFLVDELKSNLRGRLTSVESSYVVQFFERWMEQSYSPEDQPYLADKVVQWLKRKRVTRLIRQADSLLKRGDVDKISDIAKGISYIDRQSAPIVNHTSALQERMKAWKRAYTKAGVPSPLALGQFTFLLPGEVGAICAPPKIGKTFFLIWMGSYAVVNAQARVLHFTLEMSAMEIGIRYDLTFANQFGMRSICVSDYGMRYQEIEPIVSSFLQPPAVLLQVDVSSYAATPTLLESKFDQACSTLGSKPDVVLLDYLNLVHSERVRDQSHLFSVGADIIEWLHSFAKENQVAVWTVARASREGIRAQETVGARLKGSDIGQSYAFLYGLDHVVVLSDVTKGDAASNRSSTILDVSLVYSRRCPPFYGLKVEIDYPYSRFFVPPRSRRYVEGALSNPYKDLQGVIPFRKDE